LKHHRIGITALLQRHPRFFCLKRRSVDPMLPPATAPAAVPPPTTADKDAAAPLMH